MNVKEYAEQKRITIDEAKTRTGLTHWKNIVPESCDEIPEVEEVAMANDSIITAVKASQEPVVGTSGDFAISVEPAVDMKAILAKSQEIMKMLMSDGITAQQALTGIRLIGKKSKYFDHAEILETLV